MLLLDKGLNTDAAIPGLSTTDANVILASFFVNEMPLITFDLPIFFFL